MVRSLTITAPLLLLAALFLQLTGCGGGATVATLETPPVGINDEVLTWTATASEAGPSHLFRIGLDTDPARLMGWARGTSRYSVHVDVTLTGPNGEVAATKTLTLPITEKHEVGQDGNTVLMAYEAAGDPLPSGFRRVPTVDALRFKPTPGAWEISLRLRVPSGGNTRSLKVIRQMRVEVVSKPGKAGVLTVWK